MGVKDRDNGMKALRERLKDLQSGDGWTLQVGVLSAEQKISHDGEEESVTLADVAAFHEYGLGVPQRSFIGAWFDENDGTLKVRAGKSVQNYLKGNADKDRVLSQLGAYCVGGIQARISQGIPPPLAPATIQRKGSSVPLIDTGQLRTGITFRIK